jgi:hypothetical protein
MLAITTKALTTDNYNAIKTRKERISVKTSLIAYLNEALTTLKPGDVTELTFNEDVHYYSVLKALRVFENKLDWKINNNKSRVNSIAIKVK